VGDLITGTIAGLVASVVFFTLLTVLRPRLEISPCIAKTETGDETPTHRYRIKIVNKSFRSCVDVEVAAFTVRTRTVPAQKQGTHGQVSVMAQVDLKRSPRSVIPGYRPRSSRAPYAHRIRFDEETVNVLHPNSDQQYELLVRVTARDGITGFPRMFEQRYALHNQIKDGTFIFGKSLDVVP